MPNRDLYHTVVRHALEKDGWLITDDPLRLRWGKKDMYVDLAAEKLLVAGKSFLQNHWERFFLVITKFLSLFLIQIRR